MKAYRIITLALSLSLLTMLRAQQMTVHGKYGERNVYEVEQVDSMLFLTAEDSMQYTTPARITLWTRVSQRPELSKFAAIVRAAGYYSTDGHLYPGVTFADVLSQDIQMHVYAPINNALPDDDYKRWLSLCQTDGYRVQHEFLMQHMAMADERTGMPLPQQMNGKLIIASDLEELRSGEHVSNGMLHILARALPYRKNLREILDELPETYTRFKSYIAGRDTTYLDSLRSLMCCTEPNGQPVTIDSVYTTENTMVLRDYLPTSTSYEWATALKGFGADIRNERSNFALLLPTDEAWNAAYTALASRYTYAPSYEDKEQGNLGYRIFFPVANTDSLRETSLQMDLASPLLFPVDGKIRLDNLRNTRGELMANTSQWQSSALFTDKVDEGTNGTVWRMNAWQLPSERMLPDVEVKACEAAFYCKHNTQYYTGEGEEVAFDNEAFSSIANHYGHIGEGSFYLMKPSSITNPKREIILRGNGCRSAYVPDAEVMNGKYDVYVVMVPYWYSQLAQAANRDSMLAVLSDAHTVDSIAAFTKNKFKVQMRYNAGEDKDVTTTAVTLTYNAEKVDTIKVFEDFTFPYSYKNMRNSYPTLIIISSVSAKDVRQGGFIRELCIEKVILRNKETDNETVINSTQSR